MTQVEIDSIRRTVDLFFLATQNTRLRKTGSIWYAGPCPFCGGRDRFVLKRTSDGWRWLCRLCSDGKYLDVVDYVQRRDELNFKEALERLGGRSFSAFQQRTLVVVTDEHKPELPQDAETIQRLTKMAYQASKRIDEPEGQLSQRVRAYLRGRGFLPPTLDRALLGAATVYDPKAGRIRPAVVIPYLNKNLDIRAIKYRFADDAPDGLRYTSAKGSQAGFYYLPEFLGYFDQLLVVEGELNLLSLVQVLPEIDLVSTGSQTLTGRMLADLQVLARRYRQVFVWLDDANKALDLVAKFKHGKPIQSPVIDGRKWDANAMLAEDLMHDFVERVFGVKCCGWKRADWEKQSGVK